MQITTTLHNSSDDYFDCADDMVNYPNPTYEEIAHSYALWTEHVDTMACVNRQQFDEMTTGQKITQIVECFGLEEE